MLKLVHCVRKKNDLSTERFREIWKDYGERLEEDLGPFGATRISVSTTLEVELNRQLQESRGSLPPFDGIAEIWFQSGAHVQQLLEREELRQRIAELQRWQAGFVDVATSAFFFTFEDADIQLDSSA